LLIVKILLENLDSTKDSRQLRTELGSDFFYSIQTKRRTRDQRRAREEGWKERRKEGRKERRNERRKEWRKE